ncbi:hypothetical protein NONI108955_28355 [Nocardia ninae]|uniref:Uncharacterized protein n=1 Tax=Nocardia ninae NBRC 108245 TaxID=1210091 RepID=A0A511MV68_9NOCA|nr:hypothetical protein [Nocardia ninae]GEM44148.1 hypothetical protein NN4_86670 [Nocardia ninae NBRC 108245]
MEADVLELQDLPEIEEQPMEPQMCCRSHYRSFVWADSYDSTPE